VCVDTYDSNYCTCNRGYAPSSDVTSCATTTFCRETSTTTVHCFCNVAPCSVKSVNSTSCQDINECQINNGNCMYNCSNTPGSFTCSCPSGFTLSPNGLNCEDIDECRDDKFCAKDLTCVNGYGTVYCISNSIFGEKKPTPEFLLSDDPDDQQPFKDNATVPLAITFGVVLGLVILAGLAYLVVHSRRGGPGDDAASNGSAPSRFYENESSIGFSTINSKFGQKLANADSVSK